MHAYHAGILRLQLIRHGATPAVRAAAFGGDQPLESDAPLDVHLPPHPQAFSGPEQACRQTAALLGLEAQEATALAAPDMGSWAGRTPEQVEPMELMAWMTDHEAAPHGGESLSAHAQRVTAWLEGISGHDGFVVAVVDAAAVKAAVCHALAAPPSAFWRLDIAPLSTTELHARDGRWTVHNLNLPLT